MGTEYNVDGSGNITTAGGFTSTSTTNGILIPRLTTTQRNALITATGLEIFNTTTNQFEFWNGTSWTAVGAGVSGVGSTNSIPKFTSASVIGNSNLTDSGTIVAIPGSTQVRIGQSANFGQSSTSAVELSVGSGNVFGVAFSGGLIFKPQHFISIGPSEFNTSATGAQTFWSLPFSASDAGQASAFLFEIRMLGQDTQVSPRTTFAATYMFALSVNNAGTAFTQVGATTTVFQVSNLAATPTFSISTPTGAAPALNLNINPGNAHITEWEAVAFITRMTGS